MMTRRFDRRDVSVWKWYLHTESIKYSRYCGIDGGVVEDDCPFFFLDEVVMDPAASVTGTWGSSYLSNKVESTPGNFARLKEAEITANRCGFVKEPIKSDADKPSSTYKLQFSDAQLNGMSYPSSLSSSLSSLSFFTCNNNNNNNNSVTSLPLHACMHTYTQHRYADGYRKKPIC